MAATRTASAVGVTGVFDTAGEDIVKLPVRFSDIPPAIDIPVSTLDSEASEVEISLEDLPDDPAELCTLLDNEKAGKNCWVIIALAYAKQGKPDLAIEILNRGLASLAQGVTKERLGLMGWICWLYMQKSRNAPRVPPENQTDKDVKTKDFYLQAATRTLNEASRLNPAFPPLFLARGVLSLLRASLQPPAKAPRPGVPDTSEKTSTLRQALKCFDESIKAFNGRNVLAIMGRARTLYLLGRYPDALESYQKVLLMMPHMVDPDPRIGIGSCLWHLDFREQAKEAWSRALAMNPESKVANILLGAYYLWDSSRHPTNDPKFGSLYKTAMTQYTQKAYKLDKEDPSTCAMFGSYFLLRKYFPTVEALARKAIELTDVNATAGDGWYLLARKEHYERKYAKASEFYSRSDNARGGPDRGYLPAKFGVVQMLVRNGDVDGAKFRLEKIIQQTKNPESMTLLGALYAEEVFEAQKNRSKEDKSAETKKAIGLLESVRATWKDGKRKISPDESVLLYLARLYETTAPEKSLQCLQQVEDMQIAQIPEDERPDIKNKDELRNALRGTLAPQLLNNMACFAYQSHNYSQARSLFQIALGATQRDKEDAGENSTDALFTTISYNLGRTLEALQMPEEAKTVYNSLLERHKDYTEANARLTYLALRESPSGEGPKKMAKLYEAEATNVEVRALFGWYLSKSKKRTTNIAEDHEQRHYKHTLQGYDKHDRYALTGMGNIYLLAARDMRRESDQDVDKRRKLYEKAVEFFDKALQLDPKNAYAAQGIAIALVDDRKDYSAAVQILSKVKDTLKDASVYLNLGHAFAELKQYNKSIENYETALSKDRARDTQILACLGRVWLLKGMQEKSISTMNTALEYAQRARAAAPEQAHLQFNIAFVQNQIALLVISLPEGQKTSHDVEAAAAGLGEAIDTFTTLSKAKHPPYPRGSLESRASMCRTMRNRLDRVLQSQKEYEEKNAAKSRRLKEAREAELKKREDERRKIEEEEAERKRKIAEERARMTEQTLRMAEAKAAEERAKEEAEMTDDSQTGERVKRSTKRKSGDKKRKKSKKQEKEDDFIKDDPSDAEGSLDGSDIDREDKEKRKRKRRRLERRGGSAKSNKYKSNEFMADSDDDIFGEGAENDEDKSPKRPVDFDHGMRDVDDDFGIGDAPANGRDAEDDEEGPTTTRRRKARRQVEDDDDDDVEVAELTKVEEDDKTFVEEDDELFGDNELDDANNEV
ncbi:hypothetical protein KEM54_006498 [Ascosphaera aggregata]|nr:hypothetical protein KEM54_006498 [Ascosphaera aggregata]